MIARRDPDVDCYGLSPQLCQMPPYQEKPCSGDEEPQPLPMFLAVSVTIIRERYFKLLKPS